MRVRWTDRQVLAAAEHAAVLTTGSGADNLAALTQYIPLLGSVEDHFVECFRHGGGVPYERFPRFHAVMAEDSGQSVLSSLETRMLPVVPGLRESLERGIRWLDVGCGSGRIINRLAELFPRSRFEGRDLSSEAIQTATQDAGAMNLSNVSFVAQDLSDFAATAEPDAFDVVTTFDAIHDQAKPLNVLKGIRRTLKPDGVYLMQDIRASSHVTNNIGHPLRPSDDGLHPRPLPLRQMVEDVPQFADLRIMPICLTQVRSTAISFTKMSA